jgi:acyl-CoA thioesterase-1
MAKHPPGAMKRNANDGGEWSALEAGTRVQIIADLQRRSLIAPLLLCVLTTGCAAGATEEAALPPVYVALGASDAVGVGATDPVSENWPAVVRKSLPTDTQFVNLGISGATLGQVVTEELPPALDAQPTLVTLWSGVNDLRARVPLGTFTAQLDQVLAAFAAQPAPPTVVVLTIPDLRRLPAFAVVPGELLDRTVREWNAAIVAQALKHGAVVVDLHARDADLLEHPEFISGDGFHPSTAGYRRIAALVLAALEEHAARPTS